MLVNPRSGPAKAGIVLIPKQFMVDKAAMHSAHSIAAVGFACWVLELSKEPRTIDNITADEIAEGVRKLREAGEELRRTLGGEKKIGVIGAWLGGTLALLSSDQGFDACAVVCPFVRLPGADGVALPQPLVVAKSAKAPILAVFGELDSEVPMEDVRALEHALSESPQDDEAYTYPGVGHAFFDNLEGNDEYREAAERDLWMRIDRFFEQRIV